MYRGIIILLMSVALVFAGPLGVGYAAEEIKVGIVVGLTGGASPWGKHAWNTYRMIFDELNAKGGIKSMGGAKIKYTVMDHQSKPDIAGSNAEKLIRDGVSVIMGCNSSDAAMVATQIAQRAKIPFIDTTDADPMITDRGFDFIFRVNPNSRQLNEGALASLQWLVKKTGKTPQRVGLLMGQFAAGNASWEILQIIVPKAYNVVFKTTYPLSQQDFTGIVSKMKELGVDFLFLCTQAADAIMLTRAYKEMDFNPMGFMGIHDGHYVMDYIDALKKDADYAFCATQFASDLKVPRINEIATNYKNRFGLEFDATDATVVNAISVLVDALERAGTNNPVKLRDALKATDLNVGQYWYIIPDGCKFDEKNQNIKQKTVVFQIRDGKWRSVYPEGYTTIEPVFPIPPWNKR
jgi:branched-chain amino acid transport system substrate-binding protein